MSGQTTDSIYDSHSASSHNKIIIQDTVINNTKYSGKIIVDTTGNKVHSPKKAGTLSAIFPGLGQGYNHKYWKIPVIWTGFAAAGYFIYTNISPMNKAYNSYMWVDKGSVGTPPNEFAQEYGYSLTKLENVYNQYRYRIEIFSVLSVAWYMMNIIDAVVDANLMDFDVSDNLSMNITPVVSSLSTVNHNYIGSNNCYTGISLKINF